MHILRADTSVKVVVGPFVDESDQKTPETGITLGTADHAETTAASVELDQLGVTSNTHWE